MSEGKKLEGLMGRDITVVLASGQTEDITVRELSVREWQKFASIIDDEAALIDAAADKQDGFSTLLTPESFTTAAQVVREMNRHFFGWAARKVQTQLSQLPPELAIRMVKTFSPTSATKPAASARG